MKVNVAAVSLPNVTVNGAPPDVGITVSGVIAHVPGAPAVQVIPTAALYPLCAVSVPFHVTFLFTGVEFGVGVTAIAKSGVPPPPLPATPPQEISATNPSPRQIPATPP